MNGNNNLERTLERANYSKGYFDKTRRINKKVNIGDIVFHPSGNSHLSKLDPKYEGQFEVMQLLPNYRIELKNLATNQKRIVATDMLRTAWGI